MHHTTAKLITLERTEAFLAHGWPKSSQPAFARQARALRQELPPHILAAYDQLKARHKDAVVGVFEEKCGGCHRPLSKTALARLNAETEITRCEYCGRFIHLRGCHCFVSRTHSHQLAGGEATR